MADEQYKWLDRSTAERLLRGEPLETVDADKRDQADRLARALGALTAEPPLSSDELPGEANAMAAFRKARTGRDEEYSTLGHRDRPYTATPADAGVVRLGRATASRRRPSRVGRPVRFGLAATLAAGMLGGAAMVATAGVLPFTDDQPEPPGATVSAPPTPKHPLITPPPDGTRGGAPDVPAPDGDTGGPTGDGSPSAPDTGDDKRDKTPGSTPPRPGAGNAGNEARSAEWWKKVTAACRDVRDGKKLGPDRRRSLEEAASGPERVRQYCTNVLAQSENRDDAAPEGNGQGSDDDSDDSDEGDHKGGGKNGKGGKGGKDGKGKDEEPGDITPTGDAPTSDVQRRATSALAPASGEGTTSGEETPTSASQDGTAPLSPPAFRL
ncbi:hypothetical protein [Streptomyces yerevanensis]|uniref:hypothetical protein n=1 Tax=Streptomyces yerevanensis TaxID=66378 RepID=UPI00068F5F9C|nr:hypothetical protein [Streptomyces yerevanensis]